MSDYYRDKFLIECKWFNGYKPCKPYVVCDKCEERVLPGGKILVVSLMGLGAVLSVSTILKPLRKRYQTYEIVFLTSHAAMKLLENNPLIDELLEWSFESELYLSQIDFDIVINFERTKIMSAFINKVSCKNRFGYYLGNNGKILFSNEHFKYLYNLGLDDTERFVNNKKSMEQIMVESLGFEYEHEGYEIYLSDEQKIIRDNTIKKYNINPERAIGINTGCSPLMMNRIIPDEILMEIIQYVKVACEDVNIILLGGRDEKDRNSKLASVDERIIDLTNDKSLDYGIAYADVCKVILSGDSFGMHLGIALRKKCVVWFGPSCDQEVELFHGGKKHKSTLECSPCWKKECGKEVKCNTIISAKMIAESLIEVINED